MSFLGDALNFENFQLKDWWRKAKDNPEQLLIGAGDPWSAKMWGKILGKDYEPFVDQMGGPYGGHTVSAFGNTDGGVYGRARDAGVDTGSAEGLHDAAHVIAAIYGGQALNGAAGAGGTGSSTGASSGSNWARMGSALARASSQPATAPGYGPPSTASPAQFRDTFSADQKSKRRKRLAQSLMRAR